MNDLVWSHLEVHDRREAFLVLEPFAYGPVCACGEPKDNERYCFCRDCRMLAAKSGLMRDLRHVQSFVTHWRNRHRGSDLILYDNLLDALKALRRGYWKPGKRSHSLESSEAYQ